MGLSNCYQVIQGSASGVHGWKNIEHGNFEVQGYATFVNTRSTIAAAHALAVATVHVAGIPHIRISERLDSKHSISNFLNLIFFQLCLRNFVFRLSKLMMQPIPKVDEATAVVFMVIQFDCQNFIHIVRTASVEALILLHSECPLTVITCIIPVGGELVLVPHGDGPLLVPGEVAALQVAQVLRVLGNDLQLADA